MIIELFCPMCRKRFIPAAQHVYKDNGKTYCSWTCFNHRNDNKKKTAKKVKIIEQCSKDGDVLRTFQGAVEAAELIYGTEDSIRKACKNHKAYKGYLWRYKNDLP